MTRSNQVCHKIMNYLVEHGYTKEVHKNKLEEAIIYVRGTDKRTIVNWMRALEVLGFIEKKSLLVYSMNLSKCPDLLVRMVKARSQKKLM